MAQQLVDLRQAICRRKIQAKQEARAPLTGVYLIVHDLKGAERDAVMRSIL